LTIWHCIFSAVFGNFARWAQRYHIRNYWVLVHCLRPYVPIYSIKIFKQSEYILPIDVKKTL